MLGRKGFLEIFGDKEANRENLGNRGVSYIQRSASSFQGIEVDYLSPHKKGNAGNKTPRRDSVPQNSGHCLV